MLRRHLARSLALIAPVTLLAPAVGAATPGERVGWMVLPSGHRFDTLVDRLQAAVQTNGMAIVTTASASEGAKAQGLTIPGNRVVGVFRNDFARRMLSASIAAGIEAPIRFYLTENSNGTAALSYRTPSAVFAPYFDEGGLALKTLAGELDVIFERIARAAVA
jgi:uncharacterized protein (DUF302 family)